MNDENYNDIIAAQNGDKEKLTSLVQNNMGLVYNITRRFNGRGYEMEDLNQIGAMGLIKAIKNFDTSYKVKLSTYSVPYILGEIKRYIRDNGCIKVSRSAKELAVKINIVKNEYYKKHNKEITIDELSKIIKANKEDIVFAINASQTNNIASIDEPINIDGDNRICIADTLQSNKDEEVEITNKLFIQKLINDLNQREQQIIKMRYFEGSTQSEVSKLLGISQVQISRIEKKLLIEMREKNVLI